MDTPLQDRPGTKRYTTHRRHKNAILHIHELQAAERFTARADGPTKIALFADGGISEEWAAYPDPSTVKNYNAELDTYLHREEGPALIVETDGQTAERWFRNNEEYHPSAHERMKWEARKAAHGGDPFHTETIEAMAGKAPRMGGDSETWKEVRTSYGKEDMEYHRTGGPAYVGYDRKTGSITHEEWFLDGKNKNPDGPYQKRYDPITGVCVSETSNLPGRPYDITRNPKTGQVVEEVWRGRENGPRSIWRHPNTGQVEETWPNKRSPHLPGKPTVKAAAAWQALKTKQGGPFTPGLDEVPAAQRTTGVKEAAAAAAAKAAEPKRTAHHQDKR